MILKKGLKPALCSDHAGYELKGIIEGYLLSKEIECDDFGTHSAESCDYADFAHPCADAVETGKNYPGIAMCGSGNGINMTLNKHQGIEGEEYVKYLFAADGKFDFLVDGKPFKRDFPSK